MWVSLLKWIKAGSKDIEGRIWLAGRWLPICGLDNHLTDGGKVDYAPATLNSLETLFSYFWYSCLLEAEWTPGPSVAGRIR
jgi:hypothetical protein